MSELKIGNRILTSEKAKEMGQEYLNGPGGWAYPAYDGYSASTATGPLVDADLLAPVLLNVTQTSLTTYYRLQGQINFLQQQLDVLPLDLSLVDAQDVHVDAIAAMYSVIDNGLVGGTRGTRLSKVLHRKRPQLIPLYDRQVGSCYQDGVDARVPVVRGRTWEAFMPKYVKAIRADLEAGWDTWTAIADMTPEGQPVITLLRALDIVAWRVGGGRADEVPDDED